MEKSSKVGFGLSSSIRTTRLGEREISELVGRRHVGVMLGASLGTCLRVRVSPLEESLISPVRAVLLRVHRTIELWLGGGGGGLIDESRFAGRGVGEK